MNFSLTSLVVLYNMGWSAICFAWGGFDGEGSLYGSHTCISYSHSSMNRVLDIGNLALAWYLSLGKVQRFAILGRCVWLTLDK